MLQPTGPLPSTVYWRRRAAALAGLVLVLLLLIWLVAEVAGGAGGPGGPHQQPVQPAAQQQEAVTGSSEPPPSEGATPSASQPESPQPDPSGVSTTPDPSATTQTTPATSATTTTPAPPPPAPPQPCPDQATAIAAQPEHPEYRVGSKPVFKLIVTNTGPVACTRDLDAGLQELLVYAADGTTRMWSSNDCYPGDSIDVRTLQPGESVTFAVTWAGRSSRPRCAGQRVQIPAGDYLVVAKLGPLASPPAPFRLVR